MIVPSTTVVITRCAVCQQGQLRRTEILAPTPDPPRLVAHRQHIVTSARPHIGPASSSPLRDRAARPRRGPSAPRPVRSPRSPRTPGHHSASNPPPTAPALSALRREPAPTALNHLPPRMRQD